MRREMSKARDRVIAALVAQLAQGILIVTGLNTTYNPETSNEVIGVPPDASSPQGVPEPH
jgi:hypothetical protein